MIQCGSQMDGKIMRLLILPVGRSWSVGGLSSGEAGSAGYMGYAEGE